MARRQRGNYKNVGRGRRRRRRCRATAAGGSGSEDEEDEEYVIGEDDEEDEEEFLASEQEESEEEFEFGESSSGGEEEDDEDLGIRDEDEDFGEEEDVDGDCSMPRPRGKRRRGGSKPAGKKRGKRARVFCEEEEEEEMVLPMSMLVPKGRRGRKPRVSVEKEEVGESVRQPRVVDAGGSKRRIRKFRVSDEEEEEVDLVMSRKGEEEKEEEVIRSRRKRPRVSGYVDQDGEETGDENDGDEDFAPDEEDLDEEEELISVPTRQQKADLELGVKKRKVRAHNRGRKRRRSSSVDKDEEFIDDSLEGAGNRRKKNNKVTKKRRSSVSKVVSDEEEELESESSGYNIVTSDDDFMQEDHIALADQTKKTNNVDKKRRKRFVLGSSESSSDEGMREPVVKVVLSQPKPKKASAGRKGQEKGKEKKNEPAKQVCGICLSEEQKSTTRGVLNCCAHYFCFACIMEWSKVESRCPVCKRRFETVTKSSTSDSGLGTRKSVIKVQKRDQVYEPSEEEIRRMLDPYENVVCMECQLGGDDNLMLLCDICDSSAHTYCVGLGMEVPEGNWYCECCRSVNSILSYPPSQENLVDLGTSSNDILQNSVGPTEVIASRHNTTETPRYVPLPDLNASPRLDEDHLATSQIYGGGAFTVSNRRAIHNRIRILLSNGRARSGTDAPHRNGMNEIRTSIPERSGPSLCELDQMNNSNGESFVQRHQQTVRPAFQSNATLATCTYNEGSNFRQVEDAKEQVQSMVKHHLRDLSKDSPLENATSKELLRRSTHTILVACGIEHQRGLVTGVLRPPSNCPHFMEGEPAHLIPGCCSSCFRAFVHDVVQELFYTVC